MKKIRNSRLVGTMLIVTSLLQPLRANTTDQPESYAVAELDAPPQSVSRVAPVYPAEMKSAGLTGQVTIQFIIDMSGRVINPIIVASNNPWFERPAINAILQWKYRAGSKGGRAVNTRTKQLIYFDLGDLGGGDNLWQATKGKDHKNLPLEIRWDKSPEPITSNYPIYPAEALLAKRKGRAVVGFLVNQQGKIQGMKLVEASAPEFGGAAMAAVEAWSFRPATREGVPCSAVLRMEFDFSPSGDSTVPISPGMTAVVRELGRKEPRIYPADKLDTLPTPLSRRPPIYPSMLQDAGPSGKVMIEFHIDENGDAQLPRVVSATEPEFGYAAAQAVASWRFEVPRKGGKPVIARVQVPINFQSRTESKPEPHPDLRAKEP